MLQEKIVGDMKAAMKAGERRKVASLRMIRAAIKDREIEVGHSLTDEEVLQVLGRLLKQRKEAARQYGEAGRHDLADKELQEAKWIQAYLPQPLGEADLKTLIADVVDDLQAKDLKDMGRVMGEIKSRAAGRVDMAVVSGMVKHLLGG